MIYIPKLSNVHYMTILDASPSFNNLKLDTENSYLIQIVCQFSKYRLTRVPFGVVPAGDMLQEKIDKIFKELLNGFGI